MAEAGAEKAGDLRGTKFYKNGNLTLVTVPHGGLEIVRAKKKTAAITVMQLHLQLAHLPPSEFSTLNEILDVIPDGGIPKTHSKFSGNACMKVKFIRTVTKAQTTKHQQEFHFVPGASGASDAPGPPGPNHYSGWVVGYSFCPDTYPTHPSANPPASYIFSQP